MIDLQIICVVTWYVILLTGSVDFSSNSADKPTCNDKQFAFGLHRTHFVHSFVHVSKWEGRKEGNVLFNDALSTFYFRLYGVRHNYCKEPLRLAARVLLYASSHRQDNTYHGLCYTSRGALDGMRNSPMGPPWRVDPTTHRTMSKRSYHGATSRFFYMGLIHKLLYKVCNMGKTKYIKLRVGITLINIFKVNFVTVKPLYNALVYRHRRISP